MSVDVISVKLDLDASAFNVTVDAAGRKILTLGNHANTASRGVDRANSSLRNMGRNIKSVVLTGALLRDFLQTVWSLTGRWVKSIMDTNGEMERMKMLLSGLSKETDIDKRFEAANREFEYFLELATRAPFSLQSLTNAAVKFKTVGLDPLKPGFQSLIDSIAAFGGTEQQLQRASVAIQQMAGKGVVSMEELRQQLGEAVPDAMNLMSRSMGLTMREFVKQVSLGKVSAIPALQGMFMEMERSFGGSAERMMDTWVGLNSQLATEWQKFQLMIGDAGAFDAAKTAMQSLLNAFRSDAAIELAQAISKLIVVMIRFIEASVRFVSFVWPALKQALLFFSGVLLVKFIANMAKATAASKSFVAAQALITATLNAGTISGMANSTTALIANAAAAGRAGIAMRALSVALTAVRGIVMLLGGPVGVITGLVIAAAAAFFSWGNKGSKALKLLRSDADLTMAQMQEARIEIEKNIKAQEKFAEGRKNFTFLGRAPTSDVGESNNASALERSHRELARLDELELARTQELAVRANSIIERRFEDQITSARSAYRTASEAAAEAFKHSENQEQFTADRKLAIQELYLKILKSNGDKIAAVQQDINDINDGVVEFDSRAGEIAALKVLAQQLSIYRDEVDKTKQSESAAYEQLKNQDAATRDLSITNARESLKSYVQGFEAQAEKLSDTASTAGGEMRKFRLLLETRFADAGEFLDQSEIDAFTARLSEATTAIQRADAARRQATANKTADANADRLLVEQNERLTTSLASLEPTALGGISRIEQLDIRLAKLREAFGGGARATEQFNAKLEEVRQTALRAESVDFLSDLMEENNTSLLNAMTERERLVATHNQVLQQLKLDTEEALKLSPDTGTSERIMSQKLERVAFLEAELSEAVSKLNEKSHNALLEFQADNATALVDNLEGETKIYQEHLNTVAEIRKKAVDLMLDNTDDTDFIVQVVAARDEALIQAEKKRLLAMDSLREQNLHAWAQSEDSLAEISIGWMDDFIDSLAEGELNFSDFAESVIQDILKILVKLALLEAFNLDTGLDTSANGIVGAVVSGLTGAFGGTAAGPNVGAASVIETIAPTINPHTRSSGIEQIVVDNSADAFNKSLSDSVDGLTQELSLWDSKSGALPTPNLPSADITLPDASASLAAPINELSTRASQSLDNLAGGFDALSRSTNEANSLSKLGTSATLPSLELPTTDGGQFAAVSSQLSSVSRSLASIPAQSAVSLSPATALSPAGFNSAITGLSDQLAISARAVQTPSLPSIPEPSVPSIPSSALNRNELSSGQAPLLVNSESSEPTRGVESVNITNRGSSQVQASSSEFNPQDGVLSIVLEAASRPGDFRTSIKKAVR